MITEANFPFLSETKHVIAFVGAGGKTTLMYALADSYAKHGARTLVSTTTHIRQLGVCQSIPLQQSLWARSPEEVKRLWDQGTYAVVGDPAPGGKLKALPEHEWNAYRRMADVSLLEADGAKGMPCKVPAVHEPVIPKNCDIVLGVMGMAALGKPLREVCFRCEEAEKLLKKNANAVITAEDMAKILASPDGTRKQVEDRAYYVVLNQCDSTERIQAGEQIRRLLADRGVDRCVLMSFAGAYRL